MAFKKLIKNISKAVQGATKAVATASPKPVKSVKQIMAGPTAIEPKEMAQAKAEDVKTVGQGVRSPMSKMGQAIKKAVKRRRIGPFKFKDGGAADKTGRAMKKTTADAKGRAMTKAPKKMMGGGMMKGYAGGGDVTCGKATRGYGAARKGK